MAQDRGSRGSQETKNVQSAVTIVMLVALLSAAVGFAAVYVTLGDPDNAAGPEKSASSQSATPSAVKSAAKTEKDGSGGHGDLSGFIFKTPSAPLADIAFTDGAGAPRTLADFKGKWVLLNLWATWCAPCKAEMPALDRLQHKLGSDRFEVVALSLDRKGTAKARKFFNEIGISALNFYIDETGKGGTALQASGMPTTVLINPDGLEAGRLIGPAEWDSPSAVSLIENAMKGSG